MNAAALEPVRWTRRRWIYTVFAAFVLQVGLLCYFGQRPPPPVPPPPVRTAIHLAADPWSAEQLARLPALRDPTLFALPNARGFSGSAWLTFTPLEHRLSDWSEPPRWLALDVARLGQTFSQFVATNRAPPLLIAVKPAPRLAGLDPVVPNVPMPTQTQLRIEGDLVRRPLLAPLAPRSWPHTNVLGQTIVQLLVDGEGRTVSTALLERGSGLAEADQYARQLADAARFQALRQPNGAPDPAARLMWGKLIFQWHTVPPSPTTNNAQP